MKKRKVRRFFNAASLPDREGKTLNPLPNFRMNKKNTPPSIGASEMKIPGFFQLKK
jgi:hypothetical protein